MTSKVESIDRWVRVAINLAIGAAGLSFKSCFGLIGLVPLGTALMSWCPLHVLPGISTRRLQSEGSST